ncbi:MAG: hypothetical protein HFI76_12570 [Lachnospiraceae bacterium]|nr:hypothetical protein [Lachnospiraceae bacterium]
MEFSKQTYTQKAPCYFDTQAIQAALPLSKHCRASLAKAESTAYEDLGMKALLNSLVAVSR